MIRRACLACTAVALFVSIVPASAASAAAAPTSYFDPVEVTATGSWPESVAIGDVTGDGLADVLLATSYYFDEENDYKLFVWSQRPDGSLRAPVKYSTGMVYQDTGGAGIAILDRDGDGRRDVALATQSGVEILLQTPAGTLERAGVLPGSPKADRVQAVDIDHDGDEDLVTAGWDGVDVLTHDATGAFTVSKVIKNSTNEVETGDVDGDGRVDIVSSFGGELNVFHQVDDGWRRQTLRADTGTTFSVAGIEVADVSGDGRADVVATVGYNMPDAKIVVFRQTAAGALAKAEVYATYHCPEAVEAGDLDGDGRAEVVTANGGWDALTTVQQRADGTLGTQIRDWLPYASHYPAQALALGDINGDHRLDAVLADYNHGLLILRAASEPCASRAKH